MNGQEATKTVEHLLSQHQLGRLNAVQFGIVEKVWEGKSYVEIAQDLGYESDYIKQVGSGLWRQLSTIVGEKVSKGNCCSILQRYQQSIGRSHHQDNWGEAIDISCFYGRDTELATLTDWVLDPQCRLAGIFGWGGIGKTALSVKLAQEVAGEFDCVIWRSLRQAPPLSDILDDIVPILVGAETQASSLTIFMEALRQKRCLLVFDNVESILQPGEGTGVYLDGYEAYGRVFEALCDRPHQSCVVITGREKPHGVTIREGTSHLPVRSISLGGLTIDAADRILDDKGIDATIAARHQLIDFFYGNPLAIKLAATTVKNIFGGDLNAFLSQGTTVFSNLWHLLDQQFERLSPLQQQVMYWIAIAREGLPLVKLQSLFVPRQNLPPLLDAIEISIDRSLLESSDRGLTQQPVIMEYVTDKFLGEIEREIITGELRLLITHAIIEARTKDYLREAQTQLILHPLIERLSIHFDRQSDLEQHLYALLAGLRDRSQLKTGYAAGNILNLFVHLKTNLHGYDFSRLFIRQAHLLKATLHDIDLRGSHISQSTFAETFGSVISVAFSPDGETIATGDSKGDIQLREVATSNKYADLQGHKSWTWDVAFSADSQYLVSTSDCTVKLWDVTTHECIYTDRGHNDFVNVASISPIPSIATSGKAQTIASASYRTIHLISIVPGDPQPTTEISIETDAKVRGLAFSPDGKILASGGEDGAVKLWDAATGEYLRSWIAHQGWISAVAFSPDGSKIATASYDRTVKIWSLDPYACRHTLSGHQQTVSAIAWSPDGKQLVSSSFDKSLKLWHTDTGECLKTLLGHRNRIWDVAFHPNGRKIVSGGDDRATKIWDVQRGRCINTTIGHSKAFLSVALHPSGRYLASGAEDSTVRIWDIHSGAIVQTLFEHTNSIWSVDFSPDGNYLVSSSFDYTLKVWDWRSGTCLHTLRGHKSLIWKAIFSLSPDDRTIVSCSYDRTIKIWDLTTGECASNLTEKDSAIYSLAFSPNSERQLLASSDYDGMIKLWDLTDRQCIRTLQGHQSTTWSVNFSHDGKYLVSTGFDKTIKLWSVKTGECLQTLQGHQGAILTAKFSPDDRWLISGGLDATAMVWEVATGKCLKTISGHGGNIHSLEVACLQLPEMDAPTLLAFTGSIDETIKVWDLEAGTCLQTWQTPSPYSRMKIDGIRGLTAAQRDTLVALGAVTEDFRS